MMTAILVILAILILLIALYIFCIKPNHRPLPAELQTHYAHRGLHGDGVPENSLEAFGRAVDAGYGIELDTLLLNVITRPDFLAYDLRYAGRLPVRLCTELFHAHRFTWTIRGEEDYRMSKARKAWTIFEGYMVPKE